MVPSKTEQPVKDKVFMATSWAYYTCKYPQFFSTFDVKRSAWYTSLAFNQLILELVGYLEDWKHNKGVQVRISFIGYDHQAKGRVGYQAFDLIARMVMDKTPPFVAEILKKFEAQLDLNFLIWGGDYIEQSIGKPKKEPGAPTKVVKVQVHMHTSEADKKAEKEQKVRDYFRAKYPAVFKNDVLTDQRFFVMLCDEYVQLLDDLGARTEELDKASRESADSTTSVNRIRRELGRVIVTLANYEVQTGHQFNTDAHAVSVGMAFSDRLSKICEECGVPTTHFTVYYKGEPRKWCASCCTAIRGY